jgi:hypothetical protein
MVFLGWYPAENLSLESAVNENVDTGILFVICSLDSRESRVLLETKDFSLIDDVLHKINSCYS